jgi:predicted dehydrogenase
MDYTKQPLSFKVRKALRYTRLYGVKRTRVKAESYYHMKRQYRNLPALSAQLPNGRHVGIIGCGKFAFAQIAFYLRKNFGDVIYGSMDVDIARAASLYEKYGLAFYTDDAAQLIAEPHIDTVFIASNHASHAEYAIAALEAGKTVHIEKPHVVTEDQLRRLCSAMAVSPGRVALGFNRPVSRIGLEVKRALDSQSGALMLNWFVAGHEIAKDHWYFRDEEGGRVLGNLCHWTDFVYRLVPSENRFPITVNPTRAEAADADIAVTYVFGDGSIAAITFSAKGHAFEGVMERFSAHRGDALVSMDEFKTFEARIGAKRHRTRQLHRDHGHERMICDSYLLGRDPSQEGAAVSYVWETGQLFLKTKEALERRVPLTLEAFSSSELGTALPVGS